jgi:hypothetical protein
MHSTFDMNPSISSAHDDAECIRERLPRRLLELREALFLQHPPPPGESGSSRESSGRIKANRIAG